MNLTDGPASFECVGDGELVLLVGVGRGLLCGLERGQLRFGDQSPTLRAQEVSPLGMLTVTGPVISSSSEVTAVVEISPTAVQYGLLHFASSQSGRRIGVRSSGR